jgi:hypothetical protein
MTNIFLLLSLLFPVVGRGQISFYKVFSNQGYDFGQGVVQLEDSSYVVTGSSSSFVEGASQAFLLKVDSLGNYLWSSHYGGQESEGGRRVMHRKEVGFYVAGYTNSIGAGGFDAYLLKTDEEGTLLWEKSYGGSGWERINDAIMLADTGIFMVGQTTTGTDGNEDMFLVRTDQQGDTLWTKRMGGAGNDVAYCIRALNDSLSLVGGQMFNADSSLQKGYLICVKNDGEIQWESYYGNDGEYSIHDLCVAGGSINVVGYRRDTASQEKNSYSAKLFLSGALDYEFSFFKEGIDSYELVTAYGSTDKLYIAYHWELAGTTYPVGKDLHLDRYLGNLLWDNLSLPIANQGDDRGGQLIPTLDGGVIMTGYNTDFGAGGNNVFLVKVGSLDVFPNTFGPQPYNSLVQIFENYLNENPTFSVFPNPASNEITVLFPLGWEGVIELVDPYGKVLLTQRVAKEGPSDHLRVPLGEYQKGHYFLSLRSARGEKTTKRIVKY